MVNAHHHAEGRRLSGTQWAHLRARWAARLPVPCPRCGTPINTWDAWELDHVGTPHTLADGTNDHVHPAHMACNRKAGGQLGQALTDLGRRVARGEHVDETARGFLMGAKTPLALRDTESAPDALTPADDDEDDSEGTAPDPITPEPTDMVWDSAPWLRPLLDVPDNAAWPRLMSPPHPEAVGSYGPDAVAWVAEVRNVHLRWWQRLVFYRLLEHDAEGHLVWLEVLVSTARQVGKSVLLRELALWRMHHAALFGEEQLVLHTGANMAVCREVQRGARRWAHERDGYKVRDANDQEEIEGPDGSRYILRSRAGVYGFAGNLAMADEAWKIAASMVEDGLEPTLAERVDAQLCLFSTAHRLATSLVPLRRAAVFASWGRGDVRTLLCEWSAPRGTALDDRASWRRASPHWTPARARLLEGKLSRAQVGFSEDPDEDDAVESFRSQFLNVWPRRRLVTTMRTEPLADRATWGNAVDLWVSAPEGSPITVAVEDYFGLGAAGAAVVELADGRLLTWGGLFSSRPDAYAWAGFTVGLREGCTLIVGGSLSVDEARQAVPRAEVRKAGVAQTSAALPLVRSLLRQNGLVHSGDEDLAAQVRTVQLVPTATGGLGVAHRGIRSDLLRATAWAVADRYTPREEPLSFYVY